MDLLAARSCRGDLYGKLGNQPKVLEKNLIFFRTFYKKWGKTVKNFSLFSRIIEKKSFACFPKCV